MAAILSRPVVIFAAFTYLLDFASPLFDAEKEQKILVNYPVWNFISKKFSLINFSLEPPFRFGRPEVENGSANFAARSAPPRYTLVPVCRLVHNILRENSEGSRPRYANRILNSSVSVCSLLRRVSSLPAHRLHLTASPPEPQDLRHEPLSNGWCWRRVGRRWKDSANGATSSRRLRIICESVRMKRLTISDFQFFVRGRGKQAVEVRLDSRRLGNDLVGTKECKYVAKSRRTCARERKRKPGIRKQIWN